MITLSLSPARPRRGRRLLSRDANSRCVLRALTSSAVPATTAATPNTPRAHNVLRPRKVVMVLVVASAVHWAQPRRLAPDRRYGRRQCDVGGSQSVRTFRAALHGSGRMELGRLSRFARASIELTFHPPRVATAFSNGLNDGSRDTSGKPLVSLLSLHKPSAGDCRFRLLLWRRPLCPFSARIASFLRHHNGCEGLRDEVRTRRVECQRPAQVQSLPASSASTG